jgi:hypothetical protein
VDFEFYIAKVYKVQINFKEAFVIFPYYFLKIKVFVFFFFDNSIVGEEGFEP